MDDDTDALYQAWKKSPSQEGLASIVSALRPTTEFHLGAIGAADDPTIRTKARAITAQAVQSFDPTQGANIRTWVTSQLRPLARYKRKTQSIGLPERTQLDAWHIHKGTQEFLDKHNREPDTHELADHLKMPVSRIAEVRRASGRAVVGEDIGGTGSSEDDFVDEACSYLIPELDHVGRKILEHRTGYAGAPKKEVGQLAAELGISPASVSRKAAFLHGRLTEVMEDLRRASA